MSAEIFQGSPRQWIECKFSRGRLSSRGDASRRCGFGLLPPPRKAFAVLRFALPPTSCGRLRSKQRILCPVLTRNSPQRLKRYALQPSPKPHASRAEIPPRSRHDFCDLLHRICVRLLANTEKVLYRAVARSLRIIGRSCLGVYTGFWSGDSRLRFQSLPAWAPFFHGEGSGDPSPVRARPLRYRSLCSPSQQNPQGFPQRLPYAASPANLCPPFPAQIREDVGPLRSICAAPSCATGLRPPAPGGASPMNR